ncbi:MAG TPA: ParA family protein [Candidatus Wunengus sp. YC63]|uniref:ParA family protein n=1 Tax=Candidatus Wunengus sp. YC63 TaxID=3367699 RepID=UPI002713DAB1|nr:AAA family ATPase [Candidatus Brocadiales bacterium]
MANTAECIAFVNHKGGTGKTTSCISIAGFLAKNNYKTLVVDFDPQANATSGLGIDSASLQYSIYDVILDQCEGYEGVPVSRIILETDITNLHLAPSEFDLSVAEVLLHRIKERTGVLTLILEEIKDVYDYILVDLPTSSGLLSINGLCASDQVVIPVDPSIYSLEALDNLRHTFRDIKRMEGRPINKITVVINRYHVENDLFAKMFQKRHPSHEIESRLRDLFPTVFVVPEAIEIYDAQKKGTPISHFAPKSRAGKAYEKIAKNIMINTKKYKD